jgi:hypothetical protein
MAKGGVILEKAKTSDKVFKVLVNLLKVLIVLIIIVSIINFFVGKQIAKQRERQANASLPIINERIGSIISANDDIYDIKTYFKYKGPNYISVYVTDTWFSTPDIQKKRFSADIRDNVKAILFEEGFIKAKDRVGIYVYTVDEILLAEDGMYGEIKLKD